MIKPERMRLNHKNGKRVRSFKKMRRRIVARNDIIEMLILRHRW
jgi:hypothetical protein